MKYCFLNGEILPESEAKIGLNDIGLLRGYGVYDGITANGMTPFSFSDHYKRFYSSAEFLNIPLDYSEEEMKKILEDLILKNGFRRTDIRVMLTGGDTKNGIEQSGSTFYILAEEHAGIGDVGQNGAKVILHEFLRQDPVYKTTNYITAVRLQPEKKRAGALEIVYHWDGKILEASTSNIFIVKNGEVITPKENILFGITRKKVLEILSKLGISFEERDIPLEEFFSADEVFITSSFKDVVPVIRADSREVGGGKPGPISLKIAEEFNKLLKLT